MYDEHFGLTGRPFQLTPDPAFWYETATHRRAMAYLGYGLAQGEGFIVITGDIGAGKTTLVGHLLDTLDREALNPIKLVSTAIEASDLLRIVATELGANPAGLEKAQLLTAIERGLHAVARTGRRTLLIVDEAQALPTSALEELRMLSNFQAGGHALLQIVLLGQPEFRTTLHGSEGLEQLRQRVIAIHHLDPMTPDEVAPYIGHRLSVVGWSGRPDFADSAFAALFRLTDGVPRRLNQLANRLMLHAAIENVHTISAATVDLVAADLHADLPTMAKAAPHLPSPVVAKPAPVVVAEPVTMIEPMPAVAAAMPDPRPFRHSWLDAEPVGSAPAGDAAEAALATVAAVEPFPEPEPTVIEPEAEAAEPIASEAELHEPEVEDELSWQPSEPASEQSAAADETAAVSEGVTAELAPEIADLPHIADAAPDAMLVARVADLEARMEEQDAALRRVLTLLVDWVEADQAPRPTLVPLVEGPHDYVPIRGAAA